MKTTLNKIRSHHPCEHGWKKLLNHLGKTKADDEPLSLLTILDSNGIEDALWCMRAVDGYQQEKRLYALWCVRQVQHLRTDPRSRAALEVSERHAHGQATDSELAAANVAANVAARAAANAAARGAAQVAAGAAAEAGATAAARAAANAAARGAAQVAAGATAEAGATAAEWAAALAAHAAGARATTARATAGASAVRYACWAEAWDAAYNPSRANQEQHLRKVLAEIEQGE